MTLVQFYKKDRTARVFDLKFTLDLSQSNTHFAELTPRRTRNILEKLGYEIVEEWEKTQWGCQCKVIRKEDK